MYSHPSMLDIQALLLEPAKARRARRFRRGLLVAAGLTVLLFAEVGGFSFLWGK